MARHQWTKKLVTIKHEKGFDQDKIAWHCTRCGGNLTQLSGPHPNDRINEKMSDGTPLELDCDERMVFGIQES